MRVEDVLTPTTCVCRTEEGRLLDGESERILSFISVSREDKSDVTHEYDS